MRPDLRDVLKLKIVLTLLVWALPCLLLPPPWFRFVGLDMSTVEALVLCRLLGAAYLALCVAYAFCLFDPARYAGVRLVGIVSNGLASGVLWFMTVRGMLAPLPVVGKAYLIVSAVLTAALTLALLVARAPRPPRPTGLASALTRPVDSEPTVPIDSKEGESA